MTKIEARSSLISSMIWIVFNMLSGKALAFFSQVILGWFLNSDDFGVYALSASISAVLLLLANGGTQQILIQRGHEYENLAPTVFKIAGAFNLATLILLIVCAPFAASYFATPELIGMLPIFGVSLLLGTPGVIFIARLKIDFKFSAIARISVLSILLRQSMLIILAIKGFGPWSFVIPTLFESLYVTVASFAYVRNLPRNIALKKNQLFEILSQSKWIMLGTLASTATNHGGYFALGVLVQKATLGTYFFGMQLVASVGWMLTGAVESLMLPIFAPLSNDSRRQVALFLMSIRCAWLVSIPLALTLAVMAEALLHGIWSHKWDLAIPVVQILALSMPAWLVTSLTRSLIEARGLWRYRLVMLVFSGVGEIIAVVLTVAQSGELEKIAIAVALYRTGFCAFQLGISALVMGIPVTSSIWAGTISPVLGWATYFKILPLMPTFNYFENLLGNAAVTSALACVCFVLLSLPTEYRVWSQLISRLFRR